LAPGGLVVLTFPDWHVVKERLQAQHPELVDGRRRIGGQRHYLEFENAKPWDEFMADVDNGRFGVGYTYYQEGAVPAVPEYLVHPDALADTCKAVGLRPSHNMNFLRFEKETPFGNKCFKELRRAMGAERRLEGEARSIAEMYRALVLEKKKRQRWD
jgi:mRNA capping enzyme